MYWIAFPSGSNTSRHDSAIEPMDAVPVFVQETPAPRATVWQFILQSKIRGKPGTFAVIWPIHVPHITSTIFRISGVAPVCGGGLTCAVWLLATDKATTSAAVRKSLLGIPPLPSVKKILCLQ